MKDSEGNIYMNKSIKRTNDKKSRFNFNDIEQSIQETITALEKFVFDKGVPNKKDKTKRKD